MVYAKPGSPTLDEMRRAAKDAGVQVADQYLLAAQVGVDIYPHILSAARRGLIRTETEQADLLKKPLPAFHLLQLLPHTNEDLRPIAGDWPVAPHAVFVLTFYMSALPGALLVRSPSPGQLYMSILQYADDVWDCNDWGDDDWLRQKSAAVAVRGWPELDFASFVETRDRYTKILFAALHAMAHPRVIEVPHAPSTHAGREHTTRVAKGQLSPVRVLDLVQLKFTAPVEEPAAEPGPRGVTGLTYKAHWRRSTEAMHKSTWYSGCEHDWVLTETGRTWECTNCGGRKWHRREARIHGGGEPPITLVR